MTLDKIIADEILNTLDERIEQYSENTKRHHFSLAYKIQRSRIIKNANKPAKRSYRYPLRRVKYALVAVALAVPLLTGFSVWKIYGKFSLNVQHDHSALHIDNLTDYKTTFEKYYELELDDGWEIACHDQLTENIITSYKKFDKSIIFCQDLIHKGYNGKIKTENTTIESISIYEENDGILSELDNGEYHLIWLYDGYMFEILSNLDKEEVMELAKCTKIKN